MTAELADASHEDPLMISLTAVGAPPPRAPLSPLPSLLSPLSPPRLWLVEKEKYKPMTLATVRHMLATGLLASLALALRVATLARRAARAGWDSGAMLKRGASRPPPAWPGAPSPSTASTAITRGAAARWPRDAAYPVRQLALERARL